MATVKRLSPYLLVALALRLPGMFQSLWYDEAFTLWLAGLSIPNLIAATAGDVHPPLSYLIVWVSCHIIGLNEWGIRVPALLFGLALIPTAEILLRELDVIGRVQTLSMWLIATAPMLIQYSTEGRMYAQLGLIVCWAVIMARRDNWVGLAVLICAGMYTQNMFVLIIPALLYLSTGATLVGGMFALGMYAPWAGTMLWQLVNVHSGYWIPPISVGRAIYILYRLIGGGGHYEQIMLIAAPLVLLVLVAGVWACRQNRRLLAVALSPFALACLISIFAPVLIERVLIGSVPALLALVSAGAWWLYDRLKIWWHIYPLALVWIVAVVAVIITPTNSDLRSRYQALDIRPGDTCYHINASTMVMIQYAVPQCDNYLWPAVQGLEESITIETKNAMGMKQVRIEQTPIGNGRVWLFHYTGPHLLSAEFAEQKRILTIYPPLEKIVVQDDQDIANTTVWRINRNEYAGSY